MKATKRIVTKDQKLGLILTEAIRATNEGRSPTTQKELRSVLKKKGTNILGASFSVYVDELEEKGFLKKEGHEITLVLEAKLLTDSLEIDALLQLYESRDENDCFSRETWLEVCKKLKFTEERSARVLAELKTCGYLLPENRNANSFGELNIHTINKEMFYLAPARKAKLKKFPAKAASR
jgi:hypothetical protein